ncbi:MAG: hypothetical protein U9M98_03750 [Patescibacteria group bacterium]|nr:hypothetical protein [Patescibacteria group bacterium]
MKSAVFFTVCLSLIFCLVGFVPAQASEPVGWDADSWEAGGSGRTGTGSSIGLKTVVASLQNLFESIDTLYSPVPLTLSGGIKPEPQPIFAGKDSEKSVLGIATDNSSVASVVYFRTRGDGLKTYSLDPDFDSVSRQEANDISRDEPEVREEAENQSRGEVWGAKIAKAEKEVGYWFKDSGVLLTLLGLAGLTVMVVIVVLAHKALKSKD